MPRPRSRLSPLSLPPRPGYLKVPIFWGRRGTQSADVDAKQKNEASAFLLLENSSVASSPEAAYKKKRRQKMVRKGYENFASASVGYSPVLSNQL